MDYFYEFISNYFKLLDQQFIYWNDDISCISSRTLRASRANIFEQLVQLQNALALVMWSNGSILTAFSSTGKVVDNVFFQLFVLWNSSCIIEVFLTTYEEKICHGIGITGLVQPILVSCGTTTIQRYIDFLAFKVILLVFLFVSVTP